MPVDPRQYAGPYYALWRKAQRAPWDPAAIDLSVDAAQWQWIVDEHQEQRYGEQLLRLTGLFHEGEESVTHTLVPFLTAVARAGLGVDKEIFLTSQLFEEAKHFDFFVRYFDEVLGVDGADAARHLTPEPQALLIDDLEEVTERLLTERDRDALIATFAQAVTHYMGVVEGMLARTGYRGVQEALGTRGWLPGLQEGYRQIRRDEGRHVAFGMRCIAELTGDDPALVDVARGVFDAQLPNVVATLQLFDEPHPLVDVGGLIAYALEQYQRFAAAARLGDGVHGGGAGAGDLDIDAIVVDDEETESATPAIVR